MGFTDWLKNEDHPNGLASAFNTWLEYVGIYRGEAFSNVFDTYTEPVESKEDRYGGFPPLRSDL